MFFLYFPIGFLLGFTAFMSIDKWKHEAQWLNACAEGNLDTVKYFVENGQDVDFALRSGLTGLMAASCSERTNVVHFLLSKDFSALHCAATKGHLEVCKLLGANGADVNQRTNDVFSPWLAACANGHLDIVEFFVENGQDIEASGRGGITGLMAASIGGKADVVRFLLSKGARVDRTADDGFTARDLAVSKGHGEIVELLTRHASASAN